MHAPPAPDLTVTLTEVIQTSHTYCIAIDKPEYALLTSIFTRRTRLLVVAMVMIVVSGCGTVGIAAFRVVMQIATQVVVQVGAEYVQELLNPNESQNRPVVEVSHTDNNGANVTTAYRIDKVRAISVQVINGSVAISSDGNITKVTVKQGSTATIEITQPSSIETTQPSSPPTEPTLAGQWSDKDGNIYEFTASGRNSYSGEVLGSAKGDLCTPVNIKVSGAGLHLVGTMAFYNDNCQTPDGEETVILDLAADGARVTRSFPQEVISRCNNCATQTWDRKS